MMDPVHEENGEWYFWEETWADRQGPFISETEAKDALQWYCSTVLRAREDTNVLDSL